MAKYVQNIPPFPKSSKIKKRDEDEINEKFSALNLEDFSEDEKKSKKKSKKKKKDSFINDSSSDEDLFDHDEEYIPMKTRSSKKKAAL